MYQYSYFVLVFLDYKITINLADRQKMAAVFTVASRGWHSSCAMGPRALGRLYVLDLALGFLAFKLPLSFLFLLLLELLLALFHHHLR